MRLPLRTKLIASFLVVVVITGFFATWVGVRLIGDSIIRQAQDKVRVDLNSAREIYQEKVKEVRDIVRFTAVRFFLKDSLLSDNPELFRDELIRIREAEGLDVLTIIDKNGIVLFRSGNPAVHGDSKAGDDLVSAVISSRQVVESTVIVSREELLKEGDDLAERAYLKMIPTPKAKPRPDVEETSGMMIKAVAPILDYDGNLLGVLLGGKLLNRDYEIVDKIKDIVYQGETYKGKDIGTATIFQRDLRISTNVKRENGERAIGTRVSGEVSDRVLVQGLPWIDRAFVVNNWYITAYEPIKNVDGEIIGILYVGILEEKFTDMKRRTVWIFLGIAFLGSVVSMMVAYLLAGGVLKPVGRLVLASREIAGGNLDFRVKLKSKDEIGTLGEAFNSMAASLKERDGQLKERAHQTIMKSERLATLGQLAAGVAHEINNPLGGILVYSHLMLEDMDRDDPRRENLEKIVNQATRCKGIVKDLLDFARQSEPKMDVADINGILDVALALVEKQALFHNIKVTKNLSPKPYQVMADASQIQQVFINIIINAAEAMEGQGELALGTRTSADGKSVEVEFTDTGCGIPEENLEKLFDPFFSTKEVGRGTGLGLAVSYGIIERHKGKIEVRSEVGVGTRFVVRLPLQRDDSAA